VLKTALAKRMRAVLWELRRHRGECPGGTGAFHLDFAATDRV